MIKFHRAEIVIFDFDGYGIESVIENINNHSPEHIQILESNSIDIPDWSDAHPLNKKNTTKEQIRSYFQIPKDGNVYVDRFVKPDGELEIENKKLKYENERLKRLLNGALNTLKEIEKEVK